MQHIFLNATATLQEHECATIVALLRCAAQRFYCIETVVRDIRLEYIYQTTLCFHTAASDCIIYVSVLLGPVFVHSHIAPTYIF